MYIYIYKLISRYFTFWEIKIVKKSKNSKWILPPPRRKYSGADPHPMIHTCCPYLYLDIYTKNVNEFNATLCDTICSVLIQAPQICGGTFANFLP